MHEIQSIIVKLIRIILIAALIPCLGMLIIAAFNERVRRILLWIMVPTSLIVLLAYLILAPRNMTSVNDWSQGAAALKEAFLAGLPFLIVLAVMGVGAYLFGPSIRDRAAGAVHRSARRQYLAALLEWVEPQLVGMVDLNGRELPQDVTNHLRITGAPGSGKSTLIRRLLQERARQALAKENEPLPFWVDMDERLPSSTGFLSGKLSTISPVQTRFLSWLLQREARSNHLVFFVDSSVQSYGMAYALSDVSAVRGRPQAAQAAAAELVKLTQTYRPCPFIMAMPAGIQDGTLNQLADRERLLAPLSDEGIRSGSSRLVGDLSGKFDALLLEDGGIWHALAARPTFLRWLAAFFVIKKRLPKDIRELFRVALYPGKLPAEQVEAALIGLAEKNMQTGRYWDTLETVQKNTAKAPAGVVRGLVHAGLLRSLPPDPVGGRAQELVCFAHPIFLAYATALAWFTNRVIPRVDPVEAERASQQMQADLDGLGPHPAKAFANDPILADTLVFFNNLESDPELLARMLRTITGGDESAGEMRWFLAAQCLLGMPPANRPRDVAAKTASELVKVMAYDEQAARQARQLLEPFDEASRMAIYSPALSAMDETRLEQTLRRIIANPQNEEASGRPDFLRSVLWYGDEALSQLVAQVWAACEPFETSLLLQELCEQGPAERRGLAIDLMGSLPGEAIGKTLKDLLQGERNPALRVAILKSLAACGAAEISMLLALLADVRESDPVRNYTAETLAHNSSPELTTGGTLRELVRINHLPLPEKARGYVQRLMEELRGAAPDAATSWEEVVNPYLVGRPVSDQRLFFGRDQILRDLRTAVENTTHVLVTGGRGSGRTSLLYRMAAILEDEAAQEIPVRPVFFDLIGLQPHEFYETAIRTIIEGLRDPNLIADPNVPRPYTDQHFARDLKDVLAHVRTTLGLHSRLVLLVDNADILVGYPPAMHAALRRILAEAAQVGMVWILAGLERKQELPQTPFYCDYLCLPIPRLTGEEAARLVTEPVAGTFQYEAAAREHILQATQGRPDAIQAACQKAISQALAAGTRTITARMAAEALQGAGPRSELLSQTESTLNRMMDWLEAHPDAPADQVEEQMKRAWSELQKSMVQQVLRVRKGRA